MVSVIIPAYNSAGTLARAIESAINQTVSPLEIIVVDDGSEDDTSHVAQSYNGQVGLIRQANAGPGAARNRGAHIAKGHWLAFLDADDVWLPTKLERQLAHAFNPHVGLIHCVAKNSKSPGAITLQSLWRQNQIALSGALLRRVAFEDVGGFDEDPNLIGVEDYNFWLRLATTEWEIITVPEELFLYFREHGSLSNQIERFARAELTNAEKIGRRLGLDPYAVAQKRVTILDRAGGKAFAYRDLAVARRLFAHAYDSAPSLSRAAKWLATFLPARLIAIAALTLRLLKKYLTVGTRRHNETR